MPPTKVSVIVPLSDHRGEALESVENWTTQTCAADQYELLVVSDGTDRELERTIEQRLRLGDRLLRSSTTNMFRQYNVGAEQATGSVLFFTEAHCIPEPTCLGECLKVLGNPEYVGGCCESIGLCDNYLARLERGVLENDAEARKRADHWRKVFIHGFFLDQETFREMGGFEDSLGQFSEWLLAARLHERGYRLTYVPGAVLRHRYAGDFESVERLIRSFTYGELAARGKYPREFCERYFGPADEWNRFRTGQAPRLFGVRWMLSWRAWAVRRTRAQVRLWRHHDAACGRAYSAYWSRAVQYFRLEYIARRMTTGKNLQ